MTAAASSASNFRRSGARPVPQPGTKKVLSGLSGQHTDNLKLSTGPVILADFLQADRKVGPAYSNMRKIACAAPEQPGILLWRECLPCRRVFDGTVSESDRMGAASCLSSKWPERS
jgi:hypothetical protein